MYSAQNNIKMNNACTYLSRLGYKATYVNASYFSDTYDLTVEKDGLKYTERFYVVTNRTDEWIHNRLARMLYKIKAAEKERNKMKNIAFDISRDGPIGLLQLRDFAYDLVITKVESDSSPYNEKTCITAEVKNQRPYLPDIKKPAGVNLFERATPYNPYYRKDAINDGKLQIKDVIFNPPATIVFWSDGSKTVVKAENEIYDPEKGLAMAIAKRAMGNQGNYFETFKKYVEPYKKKVMDEEFARFAEEYADKFDRVNVMSAEQLKKVLNNARYRIWYKSEDGTETVYAKEYIKAGNAIKAATKIFAGTTTKWLVAKENPFENGDWDVHFGSDDK